MASQQRRGLAGDPMGCTHRYRTLTLFVILVSYLSIIEGSSGESRQLLVAIPIFANMTVLDLVGPYEILNTLPDVKVVFVSHKRGFYSDLQQTLTIEAKASFAEIPSPDIVVVPGGLGTRNLVHDKPILDWIRKAHETSMYTTSVCTGAQLMGAAGLLNGIDATTHWNALPSLSSYGANLVSVRVVRQGKIITSAGVSSGIDMALELVRLLKDDFTSKAVQLLNEYDPQPPFNTGTLSKATPELVAQSRAWLALRTDQMAGKEP